MLSEVQVRMMRAIAAACLPSDRAVTADRMFALILEETPVPDDVKALTPDPAEKTFEQRQIEDLQASLAATRERAEKAEQKYVELKRNGG